MVEASRFQVSPGNLDAAVEVEAVRRFSKFT
jgi:hypothetical protein